MSLHTLALPKSFLSPGGTRPSRQPSDRHSLRARASSAAAFTSTEATSLYEVLRVNRTASQSEIKSAYRALAKVYHPDSAAAAAASDGLDFIAIHEAYATLADPAARAVYDLSIGGLGWRSEQSVVTGFYSTRRWETDQCW